MQLGYNVSRINTLLKDIGENCKEIKNLMQSGWGDVQNTLQTEWVGADEQAYEKKLAERIIELWQSIQQNCNIFMTNLQDAGDSWLQFQAKNVIEGDSAVAVEGKVEFEPVEAGDPDVAVKPADLGDDRDKGLQNGKESAGKITEGIGKYVTDVYNKTKDLFDNMDASTAFIGEEQSAQVKKYISEMGEAFAKVTTCYTDLNTSMETLVANYELQSKNVVDATSQGPTIDTNGNEWSGIGK